MKTILNKTTLFVLTFFFGVISFAQGIPEPPMEEMGDGFGSEETPIDMYLPFLVIAAIVLAIVYYRKNLITQK